LMIVMELNHKLGLNRLSYLVIKKNKFIQTFVFSL